MVCQVVLKKFNKFQSKIGDLWSYKPEDNPMNISWLVEEASECLKLMKQSLKDDKTIDTKELSIELGDLLTCMANIANANGLSLKDIANDAYAKMQDRKEEQS